MKEVVGLVKRNTLMYLRERSSVFFSFLSMMIVIVLMLVFLGDMNRDSLIKVLQQYGGSRNAAVDKENAMYVIKMWTIAGIHVVNAVGVTLTMIGRMVEDREKQKLASFYVMPVKRIKIVLGYIIAAILVATVMDVIVMLCGQVFIAACKGEMLSMSQCIEVIGMIIPNVFVFASLMFLFALIIESTGAWSGLGTFINTVSAFLAAIYLPMGMLPEGVQKVLKYLPFLNGASALRKIYTEKALTKAFDGVAEQALAGYKEAMGISVMWGENEASTGEQILFLLGCGIICLIISALIMKRSAMKDR